MTIINAKKTGIHEIDGQIKGIPSDDFAVVESDNSRLGLLFLARYVYEGLINNEDCVIISHQPIKYFLENMKVVGLDMDKYFYSKQLVYLNYSGNIKAEISLTADYESIFAEIEKLSLGKTMDRLAIHQIDSMLNLNNVFLINSSVHKLASMCRSISTNKTSILCEFQNYNDQLHQELSISLQKMASGYYKLEAKTESDIWSEAKFQVVKQPWFNYNIHPIIFDLSPSADNQFIDEEEDQIA